MKGHRFYKEFDGPKRRKDVNVSGVVVIYLDTGHFSGSLSYRNYCYEGAASVGETQSSGVCGTQVSDEYLRERCKRVSEAEARELHPAIFNYLERGE